jgi:hypothetical protein
VRRAGGVQVNYWERQRGREECPKVRAEGKGNNYPRMNELVVYKM